MPAPLLLLAEVLIGLLGGYAELTGGPAGMTAIAVVAAGALLLALVVVLRPVAAGGALTPSAVRQRAERTEYLPLCDPDAAGRPRPRAPSALPRAA